MKRAELVVGLGFGDEGKGTCTEYLVRKHGADLVVRYNGGAQAAHNVVLSDGRHHTFAQFGAGTFAGARTFLSQFVLVNPLSLTTEAAALQTKGISNPFAGLYVHRDALVTTPFHIAANRLREMQRGDGRHGSCGMGIGETMKDTLENRTSLWIRDLSDLDRCRAMLHTQAANKTVELRDVYEAAAALAKTPEVRTKVEREWHMLLDPRSVDRTIEGFARFMKHANVVDDTWWASEKAKDQVMVFEGAQGVLLDQDFGFQPYTTWTDTTLGNAMKLLGDYDGDVRRLGIVRGYMTRHGAGPLPSALVASDDHHLSADLYEPSFTFHDHNKPNDWQETLRAGVFDLVLLRYALKVVGGIDALAMTTVDKLSDEAHLCDGYDEPNPGDDEFFESRDDFVRDIKVHRPFDLDYQTRMTTALMRHSAGLIATAPRDEFPHFVAEMLGTRVALTSAGPTFEDKTSVG